MDRFPPHRALDGAVARGAHRWGSRDDHDHLDVDHDDDGPVRLTGAAGLIRAVPRTAAPTLSLEQSGPPGPSAPLSSR